MRSTARHQTGRGRAPYGQPTGWPGLYDAPMRRDWVCWLTIAGGALAGAIDAVNPHERSPRWLNVAMCAAYFALLLGTLPASMRMLIREYRKARQPIPAAAPYMPPDDDALSQPRWRVVARPLPARARQRFLAELPVCLEEEGLADRNGWRVLLAGLLCASVAVFISADPGEGWPFRLLFLSLGLIGAVFFALVFHPHTVLSPNGVEWDSSCTAGSQPGPTSNGWARMVTCGSSSYAAVARSARRCGNRHR